MELAALIQLLQGAVALTSAATRVAPMITELRRQVHVARAAGQITAEQDEQITALYDELEDNGFEFDPIDEDPTT